MVHASLFTSLRKYRPRENTDPLENFVTEAFAWLLNRDKDFSNFFIQTIAEKLDLKDQLEFSAEESAMVWDTQINFSGVYPDMFCECGAFAFVFEHKAWSHLHSNQLSNYRKHASNTFGEDKYKIILITGGRHLHDQNPDLSICWYDVYRWIDEWQSNLGTDVDAGHRFLFDDFKKLLQWEGLGPPAPISHESLLAYYSARNLRQNLSSLIARVSHRSIWAEFVKENHFELYIPKIKGLPPGDGWGRIGIELLRGRYPGLFVGFMLDEWDHKVKPLSPSSPDVSVILDFDQKYHKDYPQDPLYEETIRKMSVQLPEGWTLHEHLKKDNPINPWHPVHIRMSATDFFRGTKNSEEQDECFYQKIGQVLRMIKSIDEFWTLRERYKVGDGETQNERDGIS